LLYIRPECFSHSFQLTQRSLPVAYAPPIESFYTWVEGKVGIQCALMVRSYRGLLVHTFGRLATAMLLLAFNSLFALVLEELHMPAPKKNTKVVHQLVMALLGSRYTDFVS
jgi:hypothetical protein